MSALTEISSHQLVYISVVTTNRFPIEGPQEFRIVIGQRRVMFALSPLPSPGHAQAHRRGTLLGKQSWRSDRPPVFTQSSIGYTASRTVW